MSGYPRDWLRTDVLRADVLAGLTAAAVVIPKAMAYATIAGLPVQIGLYTAIVPMVVYAFLGTSRPLSVSTTTTIAILTARGARARRARRRRRGADRRSRRRWPCWSAPSCSLAVRCCAWASSPTSSPNPVLTGFKAGIGLVIVVDQLPKLLGVHIEKTGFFRDLVAIAAALARCLAGHAGARGCACSR